MPDGDVTETEFGVIFGKIEIGQAPYGRRPTPASADCKNPLCKGEADVF